MFVVLQQKEWLEAVFRLSVTSWVDQEFSIEKKDTWKLSDKRLTVLLRPGENVIEGGKSVTGHQLIRTISGFNSFTRTTKSGIPRKT